MKDRKTTARLAIFLGFLGVHKFYLGQNKYGLLFLLPNIIFPIGTIFTAIISITQGVTWLKQSDDTFNKKHGNIKHNNTQLAIESSSAFINTNLNKVKKYTQRKISKRFLCGCTWILASEFENIQYIFRDNNQLLVSKNGLVERKNYELIIDNNSILISSNSKTEVYNIVLIQDDFLFLNKVSDNKILKFANQTKYKNVVKSEFTKLMNELEY